MAKAAKIVILGGIVMDLIWEVPNWPKKREAVQATRFRIQPGGKGLNQAIAAARLGARVTVISAIGQDHLGDLLLEVLEKEGIDFQFIDRNSAADTDATAVIVEKGEPGFIGAKLASQTVTIKQLHKAEPFIKDADAIMATGEMRPDIIQAAFEMAKKHRVITILNPAPPEKYKSELLSLTDYLIPNEWEGSIVSGLNQRKQMTVTPERIAKKLRKMKANNIIITTGDVGATTYLLEDKNVVHHQAFNIQPVDTTGASDAFCSGLAISLSQNKSISDALTIASAAGAMSCMVFGASTSMPDRSIVNDFLRRNQKELAI